MKRFTLVFAAMLLAPFLFSPVRTQVSGNLADAISQLLDHPAPPPPPPKDLAEVLSAMEEAAIKAGADDPPDPGDDAPIRVLIDYWERQARGGMGKQPSEKVRQRLLLACEEGPGFPPYLLYFLPNTPDAHARIKRILDEERNDCLGPLDSSQQEFRRSLREWLMCNSEYLRNELIRSVSDASDDSPEMKGPKLAALARLDWKTAEPLLKDYAVGAAPSTAMKTDWQGRDEWFLSLFADPMFSEMKDGYLPTKTINALAMQVSRDPDRWIPAISQLIGHTDRNVHNAAALCLARNQERKDALLPLLPWLSDPQ